MSKAAEYETQVAKTLQLMTEINKALIQNQWIIGISTITEDNIPEWLLRMRFARALDRDGVHVKDNHNIGYFNSFEIKEEHLRLLINCCIKLKAPDRSRNQFLKQLANAVEGSIRCEFETGLITRLT